MFFSVPPPLFFFSRKNRAPELQANALDSTLGWDASKTMVFLKIAMVVSNMFFEEHKRKTMAGC
jgi:hypothetical protein